MIASAWTNINNVFQMRPRRKVWPRHCWRISRISMYPLVLRQWFAKSHPDSGPLRFETAAALEEGMGEVLRREYVGFGSRALESALGKRRRPVLVSLQVCRTWLEQICLEKLKKCCALVVWCSCKKQTVVCVV